MKKAVSLILSLSMMLGLAACGNSGSRAGAAETPGDASGQTVSETVTDELSILTWYSDDLMEAWIEHYNELYPNVKVEYQYAQSVAPYMEKLQGLIMSDELPDIVLMVGENRHDFVNNGYAKDLSDTDLVGKMSETAKQQTAIDGKMYAVATGGSIGGLLVNMDLWEQAGLKEDPKTWDELIDAIKKLNSLEGVTGFVDNITDAANTIATPLFAATWKDIEPDYEEKIKSGEKKYSDYWEPVFEIMKEDLFDTGLMTAESMGIPWDSVINSFATGKIGMIMGASWNEADIKAINPNLNYRVMGIPNEDGTSKYYCGDCLEPAMCIIKEGKNQENAMNFLESLFDEESLAAQEEIAGIIALVDGYESKFIGNKVYGDAIKEGMEANKQFMPQIYWEKNVNQMVTAYNQNRQALLLGEKTPQECAEEFDAIYNAD